MPPTYRIIHVTHDYIRSREPVFRKAIVRAFKGAKFTTDDFSPTDVFDDIRRSFDDPHVKHLVAVGPRGRILGALFSVPTKTHGRPVGEFGWFFASPDLGDQRKYIADELLKEAHEIMKEAGFSAATTIVGTEKGGHFLRERHGYQLTSRKLHFAVVDEEEERPPTITIARKEL